MYKLGIDVGGTNTDAVLIDENRAVVADIKYPTSPDIYDGILGAMRAVLAVSGVDPKEIRQAMLGTTQCTNAIVERKNLAPIGILRIGAPATTGIRPMVDWAEDIQRIAAGSAIIGGGFEYDGRELAPLDTGAAKAFFAEMKGKGVQSIAISCVFSTVRNDHELEAARLCREVMGEDVHISISSEIGSMGLIERENATILNAALWRVAERFTEGFAKSLRDEGITNADVYLSQNDGTLMTVEHARRYPILTVACGPTNSIRGASYLSSLKDAIVVDVGGTTTDLGVIQNGFPRESSVAVTIGGVRTNFRMPDVISIGLGGGSIVRVREDGSVTVGPDSVGYEITRKALVFGGDVMTATDIAVRLGMVELGDASRAAAIPQDAAAVPVGVPGELLRHQAVDAEEAESFQRHAEKPQEGRGQDAAVAGRCIGGERPEKAGEALVLHAPAQDQVSGEVQEGAEDADGQELPDPGPVQLAGDADVVEVSHFPRPFRSPGGRRASSSCRHRPWRGSGRSR